MAQFPSASMAKPVEDIAEFRERMRDQCIQAGLSIPQTAVIVGAASMLALNYADKFTEDIINGRRRTL